MPRLRAALLVFIIGFALGLGVFAASRLFARHVLNTEASTTAAEVAARLASGQPVEATGKLSSVIGYTRRAEDGGLVEIVALDDAERPAPAQPRARAAGAGLFSNGVLAELTPLAWSFLGLSDTGIDTVAAPIVADGRRVGSVVVDVDQKAALRTLTQAVGVTSIISIALAVLATIAIALGVSRRGFDREARAFDPNSLPRDPLTGLPTRQGFVAALDDSIERATQADHQVGLLIIELEGLRMVNDVWGHSIGDQVLAATTERLSPFAARPGSLARIGDNYFALIVEQDATSHSLRQLAGKIREALRVQYPVADSMIALGSSIGAAVFPVNADSGEALFRAADTALSRAHSEGRNSLAFFDTEMKRRMQRRTSLERDLRQALEQEEFVVFYQPQLDLASGQLRGYEALVRWERPGEGILSPREFLPIAEETGLIGPLGEWVLRKACADAASWLNSGTVAVNFSAAQFRFQDLDTTIAKVLAETGLPADRLEIEISERFFLDETPDVMEALLRIKALGVRVAMDDFGSGYSSLASLANFPFDKIKIDRSFVSQLTEDADVAAIVASIVGLGRALSVDITAEGVETHEQVTLLKAAGCSIVQGFLFGAPQRNDGASTVSGETAAKIVNA